MISCDPLDVFQATMNDAVISRLTAEDPRLAHLIRQAMAAPDLETLRNMIDALSPEQVAVSARVMEEVLTAHGWRKV
jgi:hypothetical protein